MARSERSSVSVLLVDDSPSFLRAAQRLIESVPGFHVCGRAGSGELALCMVDAHAPDLALIDVRMPQMDGIEAASRICRLHPGTAVVLVSTIDEADMPGRARQCGAVAYIAKHCLTPETIAQLRTLLTPAV